MVESADEPVLEVRGAQKAFGSTHALDGADLTLTRGAWIGLLGPNGAGKTTLVRSIAGRVRLDGGSITLLGRSIGADEDDDARRNLGIIPQEIALYPLLTAAENLRAFGALHDIARSELDERVKWALAWTGLEERRGDLLKTFSGGMKRRLNIACGILHRPQVILLDEPTVGVDPQSRERIWEMLGALQRDGASLVLTTHQLDEAQQMCEQIVIIDHGKTIASGTFDDLVRDTIGTQRHVTARLGEAAPDALRAAGYEIGEHAVSCRADDIARELPQMLEAVAAAGARITDIEVEAPTLQAVFIHLTGRELRE